MSRSLKRVLALVLVVAMAGCHSVVQGARDLAASPSFQLPAGSGLAPADSGLSPVSHGPGFSLGVPELILIGGFLLVMSPLFVGEWLLEGLAGLAGAFRR